MKYFECKNVKLTGGYWKNKEEINRKITMEAVWDRFVDTGRVRAFVSDYKNEEKLTIHHFWDSDVAKWMEAAAYFIGRGCEEFSERVEYLIDGLIKNQMADGYFNSYYQYPGKIEGRFTDRNMHELYCAGHLMEAACAYYEATGKGRFLNAMERYADLIEKIFIKEESADFGTPGHEEIELALIKMYKTTGKVKYLEMAKFFLDKRGCSQKDVNDKWGLVGYIGGGGMKELSRYAQNHLPVRQQETAEGHAVRATYLYSAMADVAYLCNDGELASACDKIFSNIVNKRMYITGGIGSGYLGEAFTVDYDLPNEKAYAETCAAIGLAFFANRMAALKNDASYADVAERALYNGMMSGLSLSGDEFFYTNPLRINLSNHGKDVSVKNNEWLPISERKKIFDCSCCPPNLNRVLASIGTMLYGYEGDCVYVNQFAESTGEENGLWVKQKTSYPNEGSVEIESNAKMLCVRIPSWCYNFTADLPFEKKNGYAIFKESKVKINMELKPVIVKANPKVMENFGKGAVCFGPLVYCLEGIDNEDIFATELVADSDFLVNYSENFRLNVISAKGKRQEILDSLYTSEDSGFQETPLLFIPYNCFANRGESDMEVWVDLT